MTTETDNFDMVDDRIRKALSNAKRKDKLGVVYAVSNLAGGIKRLEEIIEGAELTVIERTVLGLHLK